MKVDDKSPKRPLIFYYLIAMVVLMLLNALVFPAMLATPVTEVGYNDFLTMIDNKQVKEVAMEEDQILFTATDANGQTAIYKTGRWPDEGLTERLYASGAKFASAIPTQDSPLLSFLTTWVFPILLFVAIGQIMGRMLTKRMGGNAMQFGKSNAKIYVESQTGKTFADVAGQDEAKDALREIVDFLHNPDKYKSIGASLPKGALLVGPPGTGKTLLAKAVAGEAKVPFFSISGSEFVEMFVGMGAAKVRDLFKQAAQKAPCIVFIDEIDTIGKKRDGAAGIGGNDEREQTLNQLLTEMDGFDGTKGVVILAATNRPESLDKALLRPGRFDRRIPVELPDLQGRIAILKVHAKDVKMEPNIDFDTIGRATSGASGAELANIINEAALRAVRYGRNRVSQEDLEESVDVVIAGEKKKSTVLSEHEKEVVAYHETGHAIVAAMQTGSAPVQKITIVPRTSGALGFTMQVEEDQHFLTTRKEAKDKIAVLCGGRAAEELIFGEMTTGASNDIEKATQIARAMVTQYGMSDKFGMVALGQQRSRYLGGGAELTCSEGTAQEVDAEVQALVEEGHTQAMETLKANRFKLHEIAHYLQKKETITGEEFMKMLKRDDGFAPQFSAQSAQ